MLTVVSSRRARTSGARSPDARRPGDRGAPTAPSRSSAARPFSDNPRVGARGQRTQQRILDAALRAFGEEGYHGCSIDRITKLARCSRVSFYQYFASKEDVFRQLAGQVARQVSARPRRSTRSPPDVEGWAALRAWVARYAEIHARYEPVFHALESDDEPRRRSRGTPARRRSRGSTRGWRRRTLPPRQLDPVIRLLLECLNHTLDVSGILRSVAPDALPGRARRGRGHRRPAPHAVRCASPA